MPTTDPAPEWEWYAGAGALFGVGHAQLGDGPLEEEIEAWKRELREREARRIPLGFQLPDVDVDESG